MRRRVDDPPLFFYIAGMSDPKIIEFKPRLQPTGAQHGVVCANVTFEIKAFLAQNPVAVCFAAGTGFLMHENPRRVITLDAAVVRNDHLPQGDLPVDVFPGAPDLAILCVAPTDKFDEVEAEIHELMDAGTRHVWILRPRVKMITVHRSRTELAIMGEKEVLTAEDVLPGFQLPAHRIFD